MINFNVVKFKKYNIFQKLYRAENFRIVDIETNAWSPLFVNLKIISIFSLFYE